MILNKRKINNHVIIGEYILFVGYCFYDVMVDMMKDETKVRIIMWMFIIGSVVGLSLLTYFFCQMGWIDCTPTNTTIN